LHFYTIPAKVLSKGDNQMSDPIPYYQCIIPPYMLRNIVENGTAEQKGRALESLSVSGQFRGQRQAHSEMPKYGPLAAAGPAVKQRTIYDAGTGTTLPGVKVREEGAPPSSDVAVNEAYDGSGYTFDLFLDAYQRNSIDGNGLRLDSTVHYGKGYDNAFWNGKQMVYGDGDEDIPADQRLFNRFTICIDVIGHELSHGVTQYEASLAYQGQPGALNESMSDVFGALVKQKSLNQTAQEADWIIGAGLFTSRVNGVGIRSMKAPGTAYDDPVLGKDPQPAHMKDYVSTYEDNGGVHINSGIPNRAFYIAATEIGGYAWEKAGRIWYVTLRDKLSSSSNFLAAAQATYQAAGELYGEGSAEQKAVEKGWNTVGIQLGSGGTSDNQGCLAAPMTMIRSLFKPKEAAKK
jgi:Zn-dependent metalloprotease